MGFRIEVLGSQFRVSEFHTQNASSASPGSTDYIQGDMQGVYIQGDMHGEVDRVATATPSLSGGDREPERTKSASPNRLVQERGLGPARVRCGACLRSSTMRRAAHPSGCARCGAGAGWSAIKYQSLGRRLGGERFWVPGVRVLNPVKHSVDFEGAFDPTPETSATC